MKSIFIICLDDILGRRRYGKDKWGHQCIFYSDDDFNNIAKKLCAHNDFIRSAWEYEKAPWNIFQPHAIIEKANNMSFQGDYDEDAYYNISSLIADKHA